MSEHSNETDHVTPSVEPDAKGASGPSSQQTSEKSCCTRGSCCTPHTSAIIAVIALILAAYAAYAATSGHDNSAIEARLGTLDSQIVGINDHITTLDEAVKSNRENLIQTKLKKALQNIQDIGDLAGEKTKSAITEVENMLKTLTSISEQVGNPAQAESDTSAAEPTPGATITTEEAAPAATEPAPTAPDESTPSEVTQPEATQPDVAPSEPATAPQQPTTEKPTTSPADSSTSDQTAVTSEAAPAPDTPIEAPADNAATTNSPPADTAPATEPSAPQAF